MENVNIIYWKIVKNVGDGKTNTMQKITKRQATSLFNEGKPIYICGCKVQPNKHNSVLIIPAEWNTDFNLICEKFIKQFRSTSTGYYCSYYISDKAEKTERNKFFKNF